MTGQRNRLSRFWQELKRRRVLHVITVYATASFAIIEVIGNLSEPLNLPTRLSTILIIVLAVGFPPAIILSWLYDLTSGTFERTKPLDETEEEVKPVSVPNAWKIATYVSFVVIVGLVVLNITSRANFIKRGPIDSLIILPLHNLTGDTTLNIYIEGLHSMLITRMKETTGLNVLSKVTSDLYKNTDKTIEQITKENNVDAAMEFDVLCFGETICFEPRLIRGGNKERQVWNDDYSEPKGNLLNVWNKIISQIADKVKLYLTPEEKVKLAVSRIINPEAIDAIAYVEGLNTYLNFSYDTLIKAMDLLNHAIELEPDWAELYDKRGVVWYWYWLFGYESPDSTYPKVHENINKAIELDPDNAGAHLLIAELAYNQEWNWEKAEKEYKIFDSIAHIDTDLRYTGLLRILQRPEEAKKLVDRAYKRDPKSPFVKGYYALSLCYERDYKSAMSILEDLLATDPDNFQSHMMIEQAAFGYGNLNRMFEATKHIFTRYQFDEEAIAEIEKIYDKRGFNAAYEEIIRQLPSQVEKGYDMK